MSTLTSVEAEPKFTFEGINHRLFIEGRGFDFRKLSIDSSGSAVLKLEFSALIRTIQKNVQQKEWKDLVFPGIIAH